MKPDVCGMFLKSLDPRGEPGRDAAIRLALSRYADPHRKWQGINYLALGIREHVRLIGIPPVRESMAAWLYHALEVNDEEAGSVAFLRDSQRLGFTFDEAENRVIPLIMQSRPSLPSSSVVGDMRLASLGQGRVRYLAYSRKVGQAWKFLGPGPWERGRIAALCELVARPRLYFRDEFESGMAKTARENMMAELALLGWVPPPKEEVPPAGEPAKAVSLTALLKKGQEDGIQPQ